MNYKVLYRKYRPSSFEDVYGQYVIVKTIQTALKNGTVSHAYLFSGPRGTGKTTMAKLIAKTVNCTEYPTNKPCDKCVICKTRENVDIIEIDAASNNGVDEIREIRSKVSLVPTNSKYKVYIIDEVHMLSTGAFNALLKTLEEPPEHVIFILATTEPYKIPNTIISRCQKFDFKKISNDEIVKCLSKICKKEKVKISDEVLFEIAELSDGGMRDSISLLDQILVYNDGKVQVDDVHKINGTLTISELAKLVKNIENLKVDKVIKKVNEFNETGKDFVKIVDELILFIRNVLVIKMTSSSESKNMTEVSEKLGFEFLYKFLDELMLLKNNIKRSSYEKLLLEISLLKIMNNTKVALTKESEGIVEKPIKQKAEEVKELKNEKPKELVDKEIISTDMVQKLKEVRVNNTLVNADKTSREKLLKVWLDLPSYATKKKYASACGMLLDGTVVAASDTHIIITYPFDSMVNRVNNCLKNIQSLIKKMVDNEYKIIAISKSEWEKIKKEYLKKSKNKEKYITLKETVTLDELVEKKKPKKVNKSVASAIDLFGEDFIEVN